MATTIDYLTDIISIPQADLTFISGTLYELDTNVFRLSVAAIQDDEEGIVFETAYTHNGEVTVAGTTFARTLEFLSPYSIQFTPDSQYTVRLVGSNNNIFDVASGILLQNQVQIISRNSGGLIKSAALSTGQDTKLTLIEQILRNRMVTDPVTGKITLYNDADAVLLTADIFEDASGTIPYSGGKIDSKDRLT